VPGKNATGTNSDQDEGGRNDRAEHLAHGIRRRLLRALPILLHVPLDVLDDDDRVVHDDAGRQDNGKERQRVDREANQVDKRERADQ
jgi:hypothetical protein